MCAASICVDECALSFFLSLDVCFTVLEDMPDVAKFYQETLDTRTNSPRASYW